MSRSWVQVMLSSCVLSREVLKEVRSRTYVEKLGTFYGVFGNI
jgi:hypothetical protein